MSKKLAGSPGIRGFFLCFVLLSSGWLACSDRHRSSSIELDGHQVAKDTQQALSFITQKSSEDAERYERLYADLQSRLYVAQGGGGSSMGSPRTVAPLSDWTFLESESESLSDLSVFDRDGARVINEVRIHWLQGATETALMIHVFADAGESEWAEVFFSDEPSIYHSDHLEAVVTSQNGVSLRLLSRDVDEGRLNPVIQLDLYQLREGDWELLGKIPTLLLP